MKEERFEKMERVTLTVHLREHEVTALQRSIEEMQQWQDKTEGIKRYDYDICDAIRWALYDGIKELIRNQRIDDSIVR